MRENYDLTNGTRIIIATDRISAFDRNLAVIPLKGQVLTQTARFWFEATQSICPNHVIEYPDPNVLVCRRLSMMPVEIVVRDYLAGHHVHLHLADVQEGRARDVWPPVRGRLARQPEASADHHHAHHQGGAGRPRRAAQRAGHPCAQAADPRQWHEVADKALALFARGREIAARQGLILVDTKYEFGFDENGKIVLADEVHTPDSSRYWLAASYPARFAAGAPPDTLDKDFVRRWVAARCDPYADPIPEIPPDVILQAAATYIDVYEKLTGREFALPDLSVPPLARVRANLRKYFEKAA